MIPVILSGRVLEMAMILTTNFDSLLEIAFRSQPSMPRDADPSEGSSWPWSSERSELWIWHLHGRMLDACDQADLWFLQFALRYKALLEAKDREISALKLALSGLQAALPVSSDQVEPRSIWQALGEALSLKLGAFGVTIDLKALFQDIRQILEERSRPITLNLNNKDDPSS
jgi:hypothetical protein